MVRIILKIGNIYDRDTSQWIETGRTGDIEWCDRIEEVTGSYVEVPLEGEERRRFYMETLMKEDLVLIFAFKGIILRGV